MANVLPRDKQLAALSALVEGCSVRSTERLTGVHRDTTIRLMVRVGNGCANLLDETMRDLPSTRLELDELWAFVGKKQRHVKASDAIDAGDTWTYVAIDSYTKLVPSFFIGKRNEANTNAFVTDLASRLRHRVQVTTDGFRMYANAIGSAFADRGVDYATLVKSYEAEAIGPGRYSPPKVTGTEKTPIFGTPEADLVSTSYVERQNLTVRMGVRRYTRLTNAFSKKFENHCAATALHFAHYNFVRQHKTLRCTPAMAAGVATTLWSMDELVEEVTEREVTS
jgi:IS1 family transposase